VTLTLGTTRELSVTGTSLHSQLHLNQDTIIPVNFWYTRLFTC